MKFYYVEWSDYSFHEIEGEYSSKKSPYTTGYKKNLKYAKLEGVEKPVVVDYGFQSHERNYTTNLEKLKEKVFEFVSSYLIYHQNHIEYYEKELYECKESLETLKEKTKHLFETPDELAQEHSKTSQDAL
jgi:hypothetical protein